MPSSPAPPSPIPSHDVSLLRLVDSQLMTNTAESTAHGLLQYISRVLGGASSVEFRVPEQVRKNIYLFYLFIYLFIYLFRLCNSHLILLHQ